MKLVVKEINNAFTRVQMSTQQSIDMELPGHMLIIDQNLSPFT